MRKLRKWFLYIALLTVVCTLFANIPAVSAAESKSVTILFTHDLHDHLLPIKDIRNGEVYYSGGYARLQSAVAGERKKNPYALLLDGGDFSMGTPFQTLFRTDAPQLRMLGAMGYDAVTLGNHEYDYRASGLADSLKAALKSGDRLPKIVQSNVVFPADENGKLSKSLSDLKQAYQEYGIQEYAIIERNGVKIGVFGLIGPDSASNAPMSEVEFSDRIGNAKRIVKILKHQEKVDLIVSLSHSGTWTDKSVSEDEILAKEVPEINVIISGHTHTMLTEPIISGRTIIGSAEGNSKFLGVMDISQDSDGEWKLENYQLKQIDEQIPDDPAVLKAARQYEKLLQDKYFGQFNVNIYDVLASSPFHFNTVNYMTDNHREDPLGNLISDSFIYAVKKTEGKNYVPVDAAIIPVGTIRNTFFQGDITAADVFSVSSLGIGPDNIPGYPLISIYLTGKELKTACEVDASISPIMEDAQLYISGLSFTFNPNRLIFNKLTDASLQRPDGSLVSIDDEKLYRVVAGLYSAQMLSVVGEKSFGLLSLVPKAKDGTPIEDYEAHIIKDTADGKNNELKEWLALAQYLQSFDKVIGVPQIPQYYNITHNRKIIDNNTGFWEIVKNPNKIAMAAYGIIIAALVLAGWIIYRLATRKKRRQKRLDKKQAHFQQ